MNIQDIKDEVRRNGDMMNDSDIYLCRVFKLLHEVELANPDFRASDTNKNAHTVALYHHTGCLERVVVRAEHGAKPGEVAVGFGGPNTVCPRESQVLTSHCSIMERVGEIIINYCKNNGIKEL